MKSEEDEAFEEITKAQGWRKRQIAREIEGYTPKVTLTIHSTPKVTLTIPEALYIAEWGDDSEKGRVIRVLCEDIKRLQGLYYKLDMELYVRKGGTLD